MSKIVYVTRRERFNAAHKLWHEEWSAEKNLEVFGKCSRNRLKQFAWQVRFAVREVRDLNITGRDSLLYASIRSQSGISVTIFAA